MEYMADGVIDLTLIEQVGVRVTMVRLLESRNDTVYFHKVFTRIS